MDSSGGGGGARRTGKKGWGRKEKMEVRTGRDSNGAAAHVGVYESSVEDLHVPYITPVECGGRADVRWMALRNADGLGLYASVHGESPPMQMSASYYGTPRSSTEPPMSTSW
ncbi:beta-galactosidase [Panicum miliaceum]|uniref:beta-galactosidase n=1 Tax=Panicum miliaceum TaxID=4540 RepID=A0A3L6SMA1_PANMI|nr:beta-galactosidase [Panicum miliaceum]